MNQGHPATYAIGDLQGCFSPFLQLLGEMDWQPSKDILWLAGDLVNRGPESHTLLDYLFETRKRIRIVLGNHDLYAISRWAGIIPAKKSDTLAPLLSDHRADDWMEWLRQSPILYRDPVLPWVMVHAAIHPDWSPWDAVGHAGEIEEALRGPRWRQFLKMLWAAPAPASWEACRSEEDAQRFRVAVFTRARWVSASGVFSWPATQPQSPGFAPWHRWFLERQTDVSVICGHWATQGLLILPRLLALDSGCVWGNRLSGVRLDSLEPQLFQVDCSCYAHEEKPSGPEMGCPSAAAPGRKS